MQPEEEKNTGGKRKMDNTKMYQLRCACGKVHQKNIIGNITEADKKCGECGKIITESNIVEIKQEFLLERG
jgi:hypothetical protein